MSTYRIVTAHYGLEELADKLESMIKQEAQNFGLGPTSVEVSNQLSDEPIPQVVAYLASKDGKKHEPTLRTIGEAVKSNVAILPIIVEDPSEGITDQLPSEIVHLNAERWQELGTNVALALLAILGLIESERKVFISYKQSQTSDIAIQLFEELVKRRFDVFLDRYSVEPAVDFQLRLEEALSDKAFVLLLESSDLLQSEWVRHEIAYSHAHRIPIVALKIPGEAGTFASAIDEAFRIRLSQKDLSTNGTLAESSLARVLDRIEIDHAKALRKRREQILGSVIDTVRDKQCEIQPVTDWSILAEEPSGKSHLLWTTPRRPAARDYYLVDKERKRLEEPARINNLTVSVVHESGRFMQQHQELLQWLTRITGTNVSTVSTCLN